MANRIWTANLVVGESGASRGFGSGHGALDDTTFDNRGTAYAIESVAVTGGTANLALTLDRLIPDTAGLVLHAGDRQYRLAAADGNGTYSFAANLPGWAEGDAACLALTGTDDTAPALTGAEIGAGSGGRTVSLTYAEALDPASIPDPSAFAVTVAAGDGDGAESSVRTPAAVLVPGDPDTITLALAPADAVRPGETVTVSYKAPAPNPLRDAAGNPAESFAGRKHGRGSRPDRDPHPRRAGAARRDRDGLLCGAGRRPAAGRGGQHLHGAGGCYSARLLDANRRLNLLIWLESRGSILNAD